MGPKVSKCPNETQRRRHTERGQPREHGAAAGGTQPQAQGTGAPDAGGGREALLESPGRAGPHHTLITGSGLLADCERMNICYFKFPTLWSLVTVASGEFEFAKAKDRLGPLLALLLSVNVLPSLINIFTPFVG